MRKTLPQPYVDAFFHDADSEPDIDRELFADLEMQTSRHRAEAGRLGGQFVVIWRKRGRGEQASSFVLTAESRPY